jgi:ribosomal protein S27AE
MSLQVCPHCGAKAITWTVDEDVSPFTRWICGRCGYVAEEDEKQEGDCPRCASTRSCRLVKDRAGYHRWCYACGLFESTPETFVG